ncbi:MAG: hypothetical protein LBH62_04170 [Nitrososphaerota archaeon]|jgi:hypothetical protein|nr:hypothetical protein [Nitrososphaerota archaeon]
MPLPVKLHGFKLGKLERNVIHLMKKGDEPHGKSILIWNEICQTYGIEFSPYPKKDQPEELYKENKYKCALTRLVKIHILKPSIIIQQTSKSNSLIPNPKGHGYNYYSLTDFGRLVADKLDQEQQQIERSLRAKEVLKKALCQLRGAGCVLITIDQIREVLWQLSGNSFDSREEFDKYWNNTKFGVMLKDFTFDRSRVGENDGRRTYRI